MRTKKSKSADLERRRGGFLLVGLVTACAFSLLAFEWTVMKPKLTVLPPLSLEDDDDVELPPVYIQKKEVEVIKNPDPDRFIFGEPDPKPDPKPKPEPIPDPIPGADTLMLDTMPVLPVEPPAPTIFRIVEDMPEFIGGKEAMFGWLSRNTRYPEIDVDAGNQGTVWVTFVVNEYGNVVESEVVKGVSKTCDREALRVIDSMPKWKPGSQRGKKVKVRFELPIRFTLQ